MVVFVTLKVVSCWDFMFFLKCSAQLTLGIFFNQMFLQHLDAPSKPPKLPYIPICYINHEQCVVSIKMAFSH